MDKSPPMLSVNNLCVAHHHSGELLVKNVSFSIDPGTTLALVGESGSGKSLTALSVMRLLPEALRITQGHLLIWRCEYNLC